MQDFFVYVSLRPLNKNKWIYRIYLQVKQL
jgi:hypothetical protein